MALATTKQSRTKREENNEKLIAPQHVIDCFSEPNADTIMKFATFSVKVRFDEDSILAVPCGWVVLETSLNNSINAGYSWFLLHDAASAEFLELLGMICPQDAKHPKANSAVAFLLRCAGSLNVLAKDPTDQINEESQRG